MCIKKKQLLNVELYRKCLKNILKKRNVTNIEVKSSIYLSLIKTYTCVY